MITRKDFHYDLPEELIAQFPVDRRDAARLMVLDRMSQKIAHKHIKDLPTLIPNNSVLVLNDTKVIPARLFGKKSKSGGRVEVFLYRRMQETMRWEVLLKMHGRRKMGMKIDFDENVAAVVVDVLDRGKAVVEFEGITYKDFDIWLEQNGHIPLPPYIKRQDEKEDKSRYQTVYAKRPGAVAAPTAGLHLTEELLFDLKNNGIDVLYVTLHVGLGTFLPLPDGDLRGHSLHSEFIEIDAFTANRINEAKKKNRQIIAVGTTSVRTLESAVDVDGKLMPFNGETNLFIYPPYDFKIVDGLITNFHLPESSLLMLVAAFAGKDFVMKAYETAVQKRYRFFSYGDAMLIL